MAFFEWGYHESFAKLECPSQGKRLRLAPEPPDPARIRREILRQAGAPIDNNIAERALKKAILHRKSALFYKTMNGAHVGDLFMSLIHTCELNKANPFDYLTELLRHPVEMKASPAEWMPWNYREIGRAHV